jgi:hypothetical protein
LLISASHRWTARSEERACGASAIEEIQRLRDCTCSPARAANSAEVVPELSAAEETMPPCRSKAGNAKADFRWVRGLRFEKRSSSPQIQTPEKWSVAHHCQLKENSLCEKRMQRRGAVRSIKQSIFDYVPECLGLQSPNRDETVLKIPSVHRSNLRGRSPFVLALIRPANQ